MLFALSDLYLVFACLFSCTVFVCLYLVTVCLFFCTALFVSIGQVIGCEDPSEMTYTVSGGALNSAQPQLPVV